MWELDHKNWCFWTVMLKKTLESPLGCMEFKSVNPKGNQPWTNAEAPIFWPHDVKRWLTRKDPDAGNDWGQEVNGLTEDEMVGWHHQLNGSEFEQALGDCDRQGSLACCSPWGLKELDMTEWLNNNSNNNPYSVSYLFLQHYRSTYVAICTSTLVFFAPEYSVACTTHCFPHPFT